MKWIETSDIIERRRLTRLKLLYHLRVFDRLNFKLLGHLADIHSEGMLVISERPLEIGRLHQIKIILPAPLDNHDEIHFSAKALWCRRFINPLFHQAGFKIEHIDGKCLQVLDTMVARYGFDRIFQSKAVRYYRGIEGYNCAQSILVAFRHRFDVPDELVAVYDKFGGGKAPDGICGALYAIEQLSGNEKVFKLVAEQFKREVGSAQCDEILTMGRLSCTGCIFTAFQIFQAHLDSV